MRNRNNPLKNIPQDAFTIIQASHAEFLKYLEDIPLRYSAGRITYINNHQFIPLIRFNEEDQGRLYHLEIHSLGELLKTVESDRSTILFIEYKFMWFGVDNPDLLLQFNEICKKRARKGGPVVLITAIMDRALLALDGKADFFFQLGKVELRGRTLAIREQVHLDEYPTGALEPGKKGRLYGQMKLGGYDNIK